MDKFFMEKAAPILFSKTTPFIHACIHGHDDIISYYLNCGWDVNVRYGPDHDTPLLGALSNDNVSLSTINLLITAGAKVNIRNKRTVTPLLRAFHQFKRSTISSSTYSVFQNVCCLLIDMGSNVNVSYGFHFTPLHIAVILKSELLVRRLLNCGSRVNAINLFGLCPLFYACELGLYKIASLLVDSGADLWQSCDRLRDVEDMLKYEEHRKPDSVLRCVVRKSKECRSLQDSCRLAIRKKLPIDIEKSALLLPLPTNLIKFIQLIDGCQYT